MKPLPRKHPVTEYDDGDVEPTGARREAVDVGRDLAADADHPPELVLLHEDEIEDGHYSLRIVTTSAALTADLLTAVGDRGFDLEYLGECETEQTTHEWLVTTDGGVHERVY